MREEKKRSLFFKEIADCLWPQGIDNRVENVVYLANKKFDMSLNVLAWGFFCRRNVRVVMVAKNKMHIRS